MAVAGTKPDEMGSGPIYAIPKLLERFNLKIDDIGLWPGSTGRRHQTGAKLPSHLLEDWGMRRWPGGVDVGQ